MKHHCNDRAWMVIDNQNNVWQVWRTKDYPVSTTTSVLGEWVVDNNTSEQYTLPSNWYIQTRTTEHIGR
jgi:hypothetical protein